MSGPWIGAATPKSTIDLRPMIGQESREVDPREHSLGVGLDGPPHGIKIEAGVDPRCLAAPGIRRLADEGKALSRRCESRPGRR
jgi:hypothetical protein